MFNRMFCALLLDLCMGSPMLMGCLNCLILSFTEGKIIEIIGDLDSTEP